MADHARAVGITPADISNIERGAMKLTSDYLNKTIEWLQLDQAEQAELRLVAHMKPNGQSKTKKEEYRNAQSLPVILDRTSVEVGQTNAQG